MCFAHKSRKFIDEFVAIVKTEIRRQHFRNLIFYLSSDVSIVIMCCFPKPIRPLGAIET